MSRQLCETHPDVDYRSQWGCPDCVRELREQNIKLVVASALVLLFHNGDRWEEGHKQAWEDGLKALGLSTTDATTKNLCDAVRAALGDQ